MNTRKPSRHRTKIDPQESGVNPQAALGPEAKAKIGHQLRMMYDEVVNQGVPDRFAEILRGLDSPTDEGSKK